MILFVFLFVSVDGLDLLAEEFYIQLLVGNAIAVGKMTAVDIVGLTVVLGGLIEKAACDGKFEFVIRKVPRLI